MSTTPDFKQALIYAKGEMGLSAGYVYKIDRSILQVYGVSEFIVVDHVREPSIPEDKEVILVALDFGVLPAEIIVELIFIPGDRKGV